MLRIPRYGFAALTALIFVTSISAVIVSGFAFVSLREVKVTRNFSSSVRSYYAAESGIEDAVYRFMAGKQISSGEVITTGAATGTIQIASAGPQTIITVPATHADVFRTVKVVLLQNTTGASFFYGVQVGDGGLSMTNNSRVIGNVYSNGNIIGANSATVTGTAIVAGGINSDPSVSWDVATSDQFFATANGNRDIAQSFVSDATEKLTKISVYLGKVGNPTSDIILRIAADNGGKPATNGMASAAISYATVGITPSWINTTFSNPPALVNGSKYWIILDYSSDSATNYWNWRQDPSGGYAGNAAKYTASWSTGNPVWNGLGGDLAFRVWIGGVTTRIESMTIGDSTSGAAHANLFVNTTVRGSLCPNAYCFEENAPRVELPISDGVIQDFRDAAEVRGGTCAPPDCDSSGNLIFSSGTKFLGPKKIAGDLNISNTGTLILSGTVWVTGNVTLTNNCDVKLAPGYNSASGVIIADGDVVVANNCTFAGSGAPGSYIMILSAKDSPSTNVMTISNDSEGVIYYAGKGRLRFSNNAVAKEATAYGINLDNNATIIYESGLANVNFSSGPSGGYSVESWGEVE